MNNTACQWLGLPDDLARRLTAYQRAHGLEVAAAVAALLRLGLRKEQGVSADN